MASFPSFLANSAYGLMAWPFRMMAPQIQALTRDTHWHQWHPVAFDWSEGDTVEVSITLGPESVAAIPAAGLLILLTLLAAAGVRRL